MEFFATFGITVIVCFLLYLLIRHEDNKTKRHRYYWELLQWDLETRELFAEYCSAHPNKGEYLALFDFFKNDAILEKAEKSYMEMQANIKRGKDYAHKELVKKRVYAYAYEDCIFSIFSENAEYDELKQQWKIDTTASVPYEQFIDKLRKLLLLNYSDAIDLLAKLTKNDVIEYDHHTNLRLGSTLTDNALVISNYDMNIYKWLKTKKRQ